MWFYSCTRSCLGHLYLPYRISGGMGRKGPVRRSEMVRSDLGLRIIDDRKGFTKMVCHGDPVRSLWIGGRPFPLCARCMLLYPAGLLFLLAGFPFFMMLDLPSYSVMIAFILLNTPLVLDGISQYYGLRESNNVLRAMTGTLSGAGIGLALSYMLERILF